MKTTNQFWTLLKFQTTINPFIWFMPLAFGVPLFLPLLTGSLSKNYYTGFYSLLLNQNLFLVGIFGAMILAPEKFQFGGAMVANYSGSEFILTRAIDRPVFYRVKATVLYLLILALPFIAILHSLKDPGLIVRESSKQVQQTCLSSIPGSKLLPPDYKRSPPSLISTPNGNVLVAEWHFLTFLALAIFLQFLILVLYPLLYAKYIFWTLNFSLILSPLFEISDIRQNVPSYNERLFFFFAAHPVLFWGLSALAFILIQLWGERRFARLEQ